MRRLHLRTAATRGALLLGLFAGCGGGGEPERMNVILITLDTTRADYLSAYGGPKDNTPNLDRLAAEGTRFELAVSTASVTPVSHASILTGRNNEGHGLRVLSAFGGFRLPDDVPTLATVLGERGWSTGAVHSAFPVSSYFGLGRGFDRFQDFDAEMTTAEKQDGGTSTTWDVHGNQRRSDETTDLVVEHLAGARRPFFLWIHYWDPHDWGRLPEEEYMPPPDKIWRNPDEQADLIRPNLDLYAAEVRYQDAQLGRLFDHLKETGLADDTILVVVADHGQGLGDHDWAAHRILYQEQIRVPLIVKVPGAPQQGVVEDLVRSIDIVPTVLDYLGIEEPARLDGRSLRPLIEGREDEPRIAFASQINGFDFNAKMLNKRPYDDFLYCAMDAEWKLVYRPTNPDRSELYDLANDPRETTNLYHDQVEQATRLKKELARRRPWVLAPFAPDADATVDEGAMAALQSLGYTAGAEGELDAPDWEWICPEHADSRAAELGRCAREGCNEPMIPIRKGAL